MRRTKLGVPRKKSPGNNYQEFIVDQPCELMSFLISRLPKKSRNNIKSLLTRKEVYLNGRATSRYDTPLKAGQTVRISLPIKDDPKSQCPLPILYEDNDIIVVEKPAGLLSIATEKEKEQTAYHILMDYIRSGNPNNRIYVVHRLDRDTSGVLMAAKNEEIKLLLQDNWADIVKSRGYTAVVEGEVKAQSGVLKSWLKETKTHLIYSSSRPGDGLEAITKYELLQCNEEYSLLDIRLETGRKNQIRVQVQDMGHPIAGDRKYGAQTNPIRRLALHAHLLELEHPVTHEMMRFEARIPKEFKKLTRAENKQ